MRDADVDAALAAASRAAHSVSDYKSETFLAVLLATLLRKENAAPGEKHSDVHLAGKTLPAAIEKPLSPGEFFAARNWSTEVDKVVLAGYFLERHLATPNYGVQEVRECLMRAKIGPPKNVNLALFQAVQRSWMMEVQREKQDGKAWELTQNGLKRVAEMAKASREGG